MAIPTQKHHQCRAIPLPSPFSPPPPTRPALLLPVTTLTTAAPRCPPGFHPFQHRLVVVLREGVPEFSIDIAPFRHFPVAGIELRIMIRGAGRDDPRAKVVMRLPHVSNNGVNLSLDFLHTTVPRVK